MRIGNVEIKNNIALAPMAGVTDLPFRLLCKEQGCGLMCTEMVSAKALCYNDRKTGALLHVPESGRPVSAQIFGHEACDLIAEMTVAVENKMTLEQVYNSIHPHPTVTEIILEVCKRAVGLSFDKA